MRSFLKDSFVRRFVGGFALGTAALIALQPADARHELASRIIPGHAQQG